MRATRNFRLSRTHSVLVPPLVGQSVVRGVIAGEACTELGCEGPATVGETSWFRRWFGLASRPSCAFERKGNGTQP